MRAPTPRSGRQAALEDRDRIMEVLHGADMVFITAGMGGGTGTGAAPVIAQASKELGILTVAVVTKPFGFEQKRRMSIAEQGIDELSRQVDSLITIPNSKLIAVMGEEALLLNAFKVANDVLHGAVQGIAELITRQGLINVDFADVRTVMSEMGTAVMGAGRASGDNRAMVAVKQAIGSPLLEDINLMGARGVLVNITAGMNLTMKEFDEVGSQIADLASDDATVVVGTVIDPDIGDELRVTVVATGLGERIKRGPRPVEKPAERCARCPPAPRPWPTAAGRKKATATRARRRSAMSRPTGTRRRRRWWKPTTCSPPRKASTTWIFRRFCGFRPTEPEAPGGRAARRTPPTRHQGSAVARHPAGSARPVSRAMLVINMTDLLICC